MNKDDEYTKQLEDTIKRFLQPIQGVSFPIVIKALTGFNVLGFSLLESKNKELLNLLKSAAAEGGQQAKITGIHTKRPNEAGNSIEPFIVDALKKTGLKASKPISQSGKAKSAGYPDIQVTDGYGRVAYIDCKAFSRETREQTFRTFYLSPSDDPKITCDAFHLLMSFELEREDTATGLIFRPTSWHIYTLEYLKVDVKHEFNAGNRDLYNPTALLSEGEL
jgi:hypothetical protein